MQSLPARPQQDGDVERTGSRYNHSHTRPRPSVPQPTRAIRRARRYEQRATVGGNLVPATDGLADERSVRGLVHARPLGAAVGRVAVPREARGKGRHVEDVGGVAREGAAAAAGI